MLPARARVEALLRLVQGSDTKGADSFLLQPLASAVWLQREIPAQQSYSMTLLSSRDRDNVDSTRKK